MATIIRATRNGRVIIEMDGCSDYYNGALVAGAVACKISVPNTVALNTTADGEQFFRYKNSNYWVDEIVSMARDGYIKGARIYEFRIIQ